MAQFSDSSKLNKSFGHFLSKAILNSGQAPYESNYKSAHSVTKKDVWTDIVPYAVGTATADDNATNNPDIIKKYDKVALTEISGTNGQARYLDVDDIFIRPFISPVDVPSEGTNKPSYGYEVKLYTEGGDRIYPTSGKWNVGYYESIIYFDLGSTPSDMGYGVPKIEVYVYVGKTLADDLARSNTETLTLTQTNEDNKSIQLQYPPLVPEDVLMEIRDAGNQIYNEDFYVDSDYVKWDTKHIDGIIANGDMITVTYKHN